MEEEAAGEEGEEDLLKEEGTIIIDLKTADGGNDRVQKIIKEVMLNELGTIEQ